MSERDQSEQAISAMMAAIAHLESQRAVLGDAIVEAALPPLRDKLAALEQTESAQVRAEQKFVTIMFADIAGFTALAEAMDPEALRDLVNACFEQLVPAAAKYGGTVSKFVGDQVMVLFGAPVAHENDPERALRAALEMMEALDQFNTEQHTELGLHFGINTGMVIAGSMGPHGRQEYSVMGEAVNQASWLEDISERDEILVGENTYYLTQSLFQFEQVPSARIRDGAESIPAYRLLAVRSVPIVPQGTAGLISPLVGRETELQALQAALERLQRHTGGIVTLVGEAGLGKSRLVAELRDREPRQQANLSWAEGRCLSYGSSIAYFPWIDMLRNLLGVTTTHSPLSVREALRERIWALCPERPDLIYPYLCRLMSLPPEETDLSLQDLGGERLKAGTFYAVEQLLQGIAQQQPLVAVCEDLHWADPTSIELLEHLLTSTEQVSLLLICVLRSERDQNCRRIRQTATSLYHHCHTDLWLSPLSLSESETLLDNLLQVENLPPQLCRRILDHAEGNPLYMEETIRSLINAGTILRDAAGGPWRATRGVAEITIPDTLQGMLMARIDHLPEGPRRILQLASVIGRVFPYQVLAALAATTSTSLADHLPQHILTLQREQLIRERSPEPKPAYIFKHQFTLEAAYNSLLRQDRQRFHRWVAETLEQLFPDRIEEQVGLLAHHWERAAQPEQAIAYLLRAGDQARQSDAHQEAIDDYRRALAFIEEQKDNELAARTWMKLGLAHHTLLDFQQARQAFEQSFGLRQQIEETKTAVEIGPAPHALRIPGVDYPLVLDPTLTDESSSASVVAQLFSGLVDLNPELDIVPNVARAWEVSPDGRKYIFYLRDDTYWSDGTSVTAMDFAYAWKRGLSPNSASTCPNASLWYDIKGARAFHQGDLVDPDQIGIQALDQKTLVVELERPAGHFLYLLAHHICYPLPQHVVEEHGADWTKVEHLVTNGPFRLKSWKKEDSITLVRNSSYHGRFDGNVQQVEIYVLGDLGKRLEMYEADQLDVLNLLHIPPEDRKRARQQHPVECTSWPYLSLDYIAFDLEQPPFDDRRVRQAFVMAIDREKLVDAILGGFFAPATGGFIPPGLSGHSPGIGLPYDPERARHLLAEAGYPDGQGLPPIQAWLQLGNRQGQMNFLEGQWRENLGIDIPSQGPAPDTIPSNPGTDSFTLFYTGWFADYPDPSNFLEDPIRRHTRWQNQAYDDLLDQARRIEDQARRIELYRQADRILIQQAIVLPLYYWRWHLLVKPWVTQYPMSSLKAWFWNNVIIEPH